MPELLTGTQYSDQSFELAENLSAAAPAKRSPGVALWRQVPVEPLFVSAIADSVAKSFKNVDVQSVAPAPESGEMFLSEAQARFLTQIDSDLDELPEPVRSTLGAELCLRFVAGDGLALASIPSVRCAVFGDDEDGVELVAHSRVSRRQVTFEFGLEESLINIVRIDERMHRSVQTCGIEKGLTLSEAIKWLNPH